MEIGASRGVPCGWAVKTEERGLSDESRRGSGLNRGLKRLKNREPSLESSQPHPDGGLSDVPHGLLSNRNFDCTLSTSRDGERRIIAS